MAFAFAGIHTEVELKMAADTGTSWCSSPVTLYHTGQSFLCFSLFCHKTAQIFYFVLVVVQCLFHFQMFSSSASVHFAISIFFWICCTGNGKFATWAAFIFGFEIHIYTCYIKGSQWKFSNFCVLPYSKLPIYACTIGLVNFGTQTYLV